jgi:hypothetical protein
MRKWLILLSALWVSSVTGAPAWTWVDADGTVHFSDTPVPGARQIELTGAQGFSTAPAPPPTVTSRAAANSASQAAQPTTTYRTFIIVSPSQQETLWNTGGTVAVQLAIEPQLQANHRIDVLVDGQRRNLNATGPQLSVPEVFRGSHTLQAVIVDQRGNELLRSPVISLTVQQTSIQNPNAPLARRPGGN